MFKRTITGYQIDLPPRYGPKPEIFQIADARRELQNGSPQHPLAIEFFPDFLALDVNFALPF
jgi:hypothetical protein